VTVYGNVQLPEWAFLVDGVQVQVRAWFFRHSEIGHARGFVGRVATARPWFRALVRWLELWLGYGRLLRRIRSDHYVIVSLSRYFAAEAAFLWALRVRGTRVVGLVHELPGAGALSDVSGRWNRIQAFVTLRGCSELAVMSAELAERLRRTGPAPVSQHPFPLNDRRTRRSPSAASGVTTFGFLGSIRPNKGLDRLLTAWRSSGLGQDAGARLVVAGRPALGMAQIVDRLRREADQNVTWNLSQPAPTEFERTMASCDVVVLPYTSCAQSAILAECLELGVLPIVTDKGNMPEFIPEEYRSRLVVRSTDELASALRYAHHLDDADRRIISQRCGEYALSKGAPPDVSRPYRLGLELAQSVRS
jgi:glycosyltransferase involved in cell wall biosynthesis